MEVVALTEVQRFGLPGQVLRMKVMEEGQAGRFQAVLLSLLAVVAVLLKQVKILLLQIFPVLEAMG